MGDADIFVKAISKNDYRINPLETEEQQEKFFEEQLKFFTENTMKEKDVAKIDKNISIKKVTNTSSVEDQDVFLKKQLEEFLENDMSKILDTYENKNEEETPSKILDLYQIIDDFEINITEEDILNLLQIENRWPYKYIFDIENPRPTALSSVYGFDTPIQVILDGNQTERTRFYSRDGMFIFDEWKKYYDLGFTTMISNVMDLTPELRDLRKKMFELTGINFVGNFYLSKGNNSKKSWDPHNHHYNVIVKVLYGETKWKISKDIFQYEENDTILIPAKTDHSVVECLSDRLTLTINLF